MEGRLALMLSELGVVFTTVIREHGRA